MRPINIALAAALLVVGCDNSAFVGTGSDGGAADTTGTGPSGVSSATFLSQLSTAEVVSVCDWVESLYTRASPGQSCSPIGCMSPPDPKCIRRIAPIVALRSRSSCIDQLRQLESTMQCQIKVSAAERCAQAVSLLPSCSTPPEVPECSVDAMCTGDVFGYQQFTATTRAAAAIGANAGSQTLEAYQLSLSDAPPAEACHIAQDINATLPSSGQQIVVNLIELDSYPQVFCPEGSYVVRTDCPPTHDFNRTGFAYGPERCAYYRRFEAGKLVGTALATGGVITVSSSGSTCRYAVQLQFEKGGRYDDTFELPLSENACTPAL
ncbi:MAG: hypothetical protein KC503_25390 [Myxococcales bacterium]|nr:hypothetical protein [Myxococcales bacterium]